MKPQLKEVKQQGTPLHPMQLVPDAGRRRAHRRAHPLAGHGGDFAVQRGRLALRIGEAQFAGQPGDVFYINPRQLHGMQTPGPESAYLAFVFPPGWLRFAHSDEAAEQYLNPLAEGSAQVENRLPPCAASTAAALLRDAAALYGSGAPGAWLGIKADLLRLYYTLYAAGLVGRSAAGGPRQDTLLAIARYIQEHSAEPLSLEVLGRQFHMSPKYFSAYVYLFFSAALPAT